MQETFKSLDRRLIATGTGVLGLASGEMGHCLYFYCMIRIAKKIDYEQYNKNRTMEKLCHIYIYDLQIFAEKHVVKHLKKI
jgi:hypothetical protein